MIDATLLAKQRVLDPTKFTLVQAVPVFREHEIVQKDKKTGEVTKRIEVNREKLREIAEENNRRIAESGDMTPVCIGHTRRDKDGIPLPATEQPPVIAYARNYRVGEFGPQKVSCILADFYVEKGKEGELNKYPRRSPEFFANDNFFDPIALLGAQTPQLDLGLVFYSRPADGRIYARTDDMPDIEKTAVDTKAPDTAAGLESVTDNEDGMHEQYMKHCYGHPHAGAYHAAMSKKYAMPTDGMEAAPPDNPPPMEDPGSSLYSRNGANGVSNGATSTVTLQRILAEQDRQKKEFATLKAENERLRGQTLHYAKQTAEKDVTGRLELLARDGYEFDEKIESARLLPMTEPQRDEAVAYMRRVLKNKDEPTGDYHVPTSRETTEGRRGQDGWEPVDGIPGPAHAEAAMQYMRTSEGRREVGEDYQKALKTVLEKRKNGVR